MTESNKLISPLRQRMLDDMRLRKLSAKTQTAYIRAVKNLTRFLGRSPDSASAEDLRRFQLHCVANGISSTTLGRPGALAKMSHVHEPCKLPVVLSLEEVTRLLEAAGSLKYQAALAVAYGAGLRVSRDRAPHGKRYR